MTTEDPQSGQPGSAGTPAGGPPPPPPAPPGGMPGAAAQPAAAGAPTSESNGAAVTSLIFGILSYLCLGPIGAIVAIITGVIGRKKQYQRGMATTGLWLGIINLVLGVVLTIIFSVAAVAGVGWFAANTKVVSSSDYEFVITDCQISSSSVPSADFDITNTDSEKRNFAVEIEFVSSSGSDSSSGTAIVTNIAPGETKSGSVTGFSLSGNTNRGECKLKEVRNFFS